MIDLTISKEGRARAVKKARDRGFVVPTLRQMYDPSAVPQDILDKLGATGLWEVDPVNMFRISWHNEPAQQGGLFGPVNYVELPSALTGVAARIVCLVGKWFPTGCHKVGASFGCLAPRLVTGQFDPTYHKAVWPSTGNYCRGGAFNSKLLACDSIAILPEGMSRERFEWLGSVGAEVIATPGSESNVKEIFDKTNELRKRPDCMIFNQFEEMGNVLWHYNVTGRAIAEVYETIKTPTSRMAGVCFTSGSAGTLSAGDYIKDVYPRAKLAVGEALQCPTILENGFGAHRIEGIGDKHIPWIHNVKNTDMAVAIDDADPMALLRLFNEPAGKSYLKEELGLDPALVESLSLFGISGIANMLVAIKMAKYYELTGDDVIGTVLTDSADMYLSRVKELAEEEGAYTGAKAAVGYAAHLAGVKTDSLEELTYAVRRRVHNLKYYTWVEQQGKSIEELDAQWYDPDYWSGVHRQADELDRLIEAFNADAAGK
ncbi:MAG TPA: pyridoxal-phosphate dependent enzyme [Terriglobales bacterium]|nr:pyridoxal-phosphate dependent enzyme [Terriglobales bacterium]